MISKTERGAIPPPRTFKCLKKTPEANGAEVEVEVDGEVDGEVFNEEVDEDAETLPLPGLSEDITSLNSETPESLGVRPCEPRLSSPVDTSRFTSPVYTSRHGSPNHVTRVDFIVGFYSGIVT